MKDQESWNPENVKKQYLKILEHIKYSEKPNHQT